MVICLVLIALLVGSYFYFTKPITYTDAIIIANFSFALYQSDKLSITDIVDEIAVCKQINAKHRMLLLKAKVYYFRKKAGTSTGKKQAFLRYNLMRCGIPVIIIALLAAYVLSHSPSAHYTGKENSVDTIASCPAPVVHTDESKFGYEVDDGEITLLLFKTYDEDIVIPPQINGMPVRKIGLRAFADCINLKSIYIPDSVTEIGYAAFCNCTSLKTVTIPHSVTKIESNAFYNCTALTTVHIEGDAVEFGKSAFYNCPQLTDIYVNTTENCIGLDEAFSLCEKLKGIS